MSRVTVHTTFLVVIVCLFSCTKKITGGTNTTADPSIAEATQYFNESLSSIAVGNKAGANIRLSTQRAPLWDSAYTVQSTTGTLVIVPVKFSKALYMQTAYSGPVLFNLNDANKLVFFKDSAKQFHCLSATFFPDSNFLNGKNKQFTGSIYSESWDGSTSTQYRFNADGSMQATANPTPNAVNDFTAQMVHSGKETDLEISVCSTISGYNYSADDPGETYSWSEESCGNVEVSDGSPVMNSLARDIGGGGGGGAAALRAAMTVTVAAGTRPIADITQYFGCFTISSDASKSYSVQICVDQPDPGTRTPWTFTSNALGGSSLGGNPVNVGHTFLVLTENDGGTVITRNVGFYPTTFVSPTPPRYATTQGMLNDDEDHGYNVSLTISDLSSTQFQEILNYVSMGNNTGFSYDINSNNCTTFAISAVGAAGIALPATKGTWPNGGGDDPGDLGEDIANMSLGSNMNRNTVSNPHPNTGNCQ